eukprot:794862-Rhodomonas_salina.1
MLLRHVRYCARVYAATACPVLTSAMSGTDMRGTALGCKARPSLRKTRGRYACRDPRSQPRLSQYRTSLAQYRTSLAQYRTWPSAGVAR